MLDFVRQFYDKRIWWALGGLLFLHLVAASVQGSFWAWIPLVAIGIAVFAISLKRLEWGMAIAFLEIFVGGHGHLIDVDVAGFSLALRHVIFAAVMGAWLVLLILGKVRPRYATHRDLPFALFAFAIAIAAVKGFATNDAGAAFDDMNGFLTLAYFFPMISIAWTADRRRLLLQTFFVAAVWVALTSFVYVYAFTHLPGLASHELYTFVRDARLAEVTLLTFGPILEKLGTEPWHFRIFQQSQAIAVAFELLLLAATFTLWRERWERLPWFVAGLHVMMIATLVTSQSRSFIVGFVIGFASLLALLVFTRPSLYTVVKRHLQIGLYAVVAVFLLLCLVVIPIPPRPDLSESSFYKGKDDNTREVAVSSRWNLLRPMLEEIGSDPIIGSGFGETVTFISDDPRLRAINPTGEVTTYRFEWGYHDIWLKMGLLGLLAVGWMFVTIMSVALETVLRRDQQYWIVAGLAAGVAMLYTTHIFSPYLNHPIGLGFLLFILPFFPWEAESIAAEETNRVSRPASSIVPKPSVSIVFHKDV